MKNPVTAIVCPALAAAALAFAACWVPPAQAQEAPAGIKLVVGFPPGGALDILARALAEQMRSPGGEPVIVENRPGAASRLSIDHVRQAKADGKTVLLASSAPMIIFPMTYKRLSYDLDRDFVPVAHLVEVPTIVSTGADSPYRTVEQYVAWLRNNPGQNGVGLTSLGGFLHFAVLGMSKSIGMPLSPVPYKGGAPLVTDLVGHHVPIATDALASQLELYRAGRVRILGVSGERRNPTLPDVPTMKEAGIDAFIHANASYSAYVPAGTPREVVDRLERALIQALRQPQVQAQLARVGLEPTGLPGATLAKQLQAERAFWRPIVDASGFKAEE